MNVTPDDDLAIISSGGAAFAASITAREADARLVIIERDVAKQSCCMA